MSILRRVALLLMAVTIMHDPDSTYWEYTSGNGEIGLSMDEYMVVKVYRRRHTDHRAPTAPKMEAVTVTPEMEYV